MALITRHGMMTNATVVDHDNPDYLRLMQKRDAGAAINVPVLGFPLTSAGHVVKAIVKGPTRSVRGTALRRTIATDFQCNLMESGCIIETVGLRRSFLKFLHDNAANKGQKERADREYKQFMNLTRSMPDEAILWVACITDAGKFLVSSAGVLKQADVDIKTVQVGGKSLYEQLASVVGNNKVAKDALGYLNMRELPNVRYGVAPTEAEIKQAVSLLGVLLTIRGFHSGGRTGADVIAEWNLIAQPLLEANTNTVFTSWELPWSITAFSSLNIDDADRLRGMYVAPYLSTAMSIIASDASSIQAADVRLITALEVGKWNFTNNTYTVRMDVGTVTIDPKYNSVVKHALAMKKASVDAVASEILQAASVYGQVSGSGDLWTQALYAEWLGIKGLAGSASINLG